MWLSRRELNRILAYSHKLETKVSDLEQQLRDERDRNRRREDDLVNQVLLASGRYGIEAAKPKPPAEPKPYKRPRLDGMQDALRLALRKAAVDAGRSAHEGEEEFWAQLEGRPSTVVPLDEPYVVPS